MADKLYLIDLDVAKSFSEEFTQFFTDFISDEPTAILTSATASSLPPEWIQRAKYIFASDCNEVYANNKLIYKNVLMLTTEVQRWIQSKALPYTKALHRVNMVADPYSTAALVREFNELFSEYQAAACTDGFYISEPGDSRLSISALISSDYRVRFITPIRAVGRDNHALARAISARGTVFHANSETELRELLLFLQEK